MAGLAIALILVMVPEGRIASAVATAASVVVVAAVVAGTRRYRPRGRLGWYLLAAACPVSALAECTQIFNAPAVVVSVADGIATAGSLLLGGAGIAVLARQRGRSEWNLVTMLDYAVIVVAGAVFAFDVVLWHETGIAFQQSAALVGCIAAVGIFTLVVRMLSNKRTTFVSRSLAFVAIFGVLSGAFSAFEISAHSFPAAFQILAEYCIAMAALHPAMTSFSEPVERKIKSFTVFRTTLLAAALLVTTIDAAVVMYRMSGSVNVVWLAGSIAIAAAIGMRVRMLLGERDEARKLEAAQNAMLRVLTRAGEQLSSAMSAESALNIAESVAGEVVPGGVELLDSHDCSHEGSECVSVVIATEAHSYGVLVARLVDDAPAHNSFREFLYQLANMLVLSLGRIEAEDARRRSHKLEAVGRLAGGLAHELNSPLQFLQDNVDYLRDAFNRAMLYVPEEAVAADDELSFMKDDVEQAAGQTLDGLRRAAGIVRAMRTVGEAKTKDAELVDLNQLVKSVITLAQPQLSVVANVQQLLGATRFAVCNSAELSEVLMILLSNSSEELARVYGGKNPASMLRVETGDAGDGVTISVVDNGGGIPEAVAERIWDQFFTTKEVGSGAGLGLSVARSLIEQMGGTITFASPLASDSSEEVASAGHPGTVFTIFLPGALQPS